MRLAVNRWQGAALTAVLAVLTSACDLKRAPVLDPKGPIALAERDLLFDAFYVMMLVIVPIIILTLWFAWKYRATNTEAKYTPTWANSVKLDAITGSNTGDETAAGILAKLLTVDGPGSQLDADTLKLSIEGVEIAIGHQLAHVLCNNRI